jgi:rhodanese-related sulfurtransferase
MSATMATQSKRPDDAKALLDSGAGWKYLDVRSVEEFDAGHASGAWNIPLFHRGPAGMTPNTEFESVVQRVFPRDSKLVVGCASGGRSMRACEVLAAAGYVDLVNLEGGFLGARDEMGRAIHGWASAGLPVEKTATPERTYAGLLRPAK